MIFYSAIYDPPDGSIDPRPRCVGHCCRSFSLEQPYSVVLEEASKVRANPAYHSFIPEVIKIAEMLIPIKTLRKKEIFTCKHLSLDGNCTIYETRPPMCRDFPGPSPCPYRSCGSYGSQPFWRRIWNWLVT